MVCAAAWLIAWSAWRTEPAAFDFIALYASARLVATGQAGSVTDREAILAMEHAVRPERTILLNNPNPPAVSLLLAPLGALPFELAYAAMLTLAVAALAATAFLLAPLAPVEQRARLLPLALLAPPSLIALVHGQTTPFVLLAFAASLRAPPAAAGALLGLAALRPQWLPLFALLALLDRGRRAAFLLVVGAVALVSVLLVGIDGLARYPELLGPAAAELRPGELGLAALARRAGLGRDDPLATLAMAAVVVLAAAVFVLRSEPGRRAVLAAPATLLSVPHVLVHDAVLAYPAVAARSSSTRAAYAWAVSGVLVAIVHIAGIPVAPLWLLALLFVRW